ncbi:MAG: hypothetical protein KGN16_08250 [Burkholderiales bacterium]|nr:hypothetical protein [Burkholderiales bacterium]
MRYGAGPFYSDVKVHAATNRAMFVNGSIDDIGYSIADYGYRHDRSGSGRTRRRARQRFARGDRRQDALPAASLHAGLRCDESLRRGLPNQGTGRTSAFSRP